MMNPVYVRADLAEVYLPVAQMLQIDRVMEVTADGVRCEMDLAAHWVFPLHFPKAPIFPACLMIEAAGQAVAIWAFHHKVPGNPRLARAKASFERAVRPDDGNLSFVGKIRRRRNICVGAVELFCGAWPKSKRRSRGSRSRLIATPFRAFQDIVHTLGHPFWAILKETSAKVAHLVLSIPEECNNPSRWLSQQATPPVFWSL
jgi:3-hydroxymyristoyl/3-hydroxydecanoyl-(acyl carrier protein) dehydratase